MVHQRKRVLLTSFLKKRQSSALLKFGEDATQQVLARARPDIFDFTTAIPRNILVRFMNASARLGSVPVVRDSFVVKDETKAANDNTLAYSQDSPKDPGTAEISSGGMAWENPPIEEQDGGCDDHNRYSLCELKCPSHLLKLNY